MRAIGNWCDVCGSPWWHSRADGSAECECCGYLHVLVPAPRRLGGTQQARVCRIPPSGRTGRSSAAQAPPRVTVLQLHNAARSRVRHKEPES